jgi:hypothetical protein
VPRRLLLCAALLAFASSASAVDGEVEVGLGGVVPADGWTPLKVRLALEADAAPLVGRVILDRPSFAVSGYAAAFSLQPGASTVVRLCVPVGLGKSYAVRIEDADGETLRTIEPQADWHSLENRERLAILLAPTGLGILSGKSHGKDRPRLAHLSPADLPRDPRPLQEASAIFIPGDADAALVDLCGDAGAVEVLERYVQDGGRLVFLAKPGVPPPWQGTAAEVLLPVQGYTLRSLPAESFEFLLGSLPAGDVAVLEGKLRPGASWRQHSGSVGIIAERAVGQGTVAFVGFDLDEARVRNASKLERLVATLTPTRGRPPWRLKPKRLQKVAAEVFQGRAPLSTLGFVFLAAAIALHVLIMGPIASLASKRRSPWPPLLLPPALSFTLGCAILLVGAATRGDPEARSIEFVVHGEGHAESQLELGLYAGADASFSLDLPRRWNPTLQKRAALDYLTFRAPGPALVFRDGRPVSLAPIAVPARGFSQLRLRGRATGGPRLSIVCDPQDVNVVEVTNRGSEPLSALHLVVFEGKSARIQKVATLAPGESSRCDRRSGVALQRKLDITGDLFDPLDAEAEPILIHRVAELLFMKHGRAPLSSASTDTDAPKTDREFPSAWVLNIDLAAAPPATVRADGEPLSPQQIRCVRVDLLPVRDP